MGLLKKESFICLDCETTGLSQTTDQIIEVAVVRFNFDTIFESYETLIDPLCPIPTESTAIHHITDEMVKGKPKINEVLPHIIELVDQHIVVGHGIGFDLGILSEAAKRQNIKNPFDKLTFIDTLRLARLYGESPTNSLEMLRHHFNIEEEGAHRAMSDVIVNIKVFEKLSRQFKTTQQVLDRLKKPIELKTMPLGKHKGRPFREIPIDYLHWASHQDFDQDLIYSINLERKKRRNSKTFQSSSNPFADL